MTAEQSQPASTSEPGRYQVIHLGGLSAAVVPLAEFRRLQALERQATPDALEAAEIEATLAQHDEWVATGRPGALSHEEAMAALLDSQ